MKTEDRLGKHCPIQYQTNNLGQPVGLPLAWQTATTPAPLTISGRHAQLQPLDADRHAEALYRDIQGQPQEAIWTYMPYGPFQRFADYQQWLQQACSHNDPLFFCITNVDGEAKGVFSLAAIEPQKGSIELAHVMFMPSMQKTALATEAVYLILKYVFELGFRRCEWKCNALNSASKKAALRFGFSYEGLFRNAMVVKNRNRDTAWFGMTSEDWPAVMPAFKNWLSPDNFDSGGRQIQPLSRYTQPRHRRLIIDPLGTNSETETLLTTL
ncbi:GNAT family N-acetyltransferase [Teredinibacter haidensis]|uniref:GNAT family N-acetyltransferase n=1 Tax=Teredinibacter haidensis TaxID=2731755 RepID=UPI0009F9F349|nr:GNAT family protein [Teredinibacter haidensis]